MIEEQLKLILTEYVRQDAREGTPEGERHLHIRDTVREWTERDPDLAWRFIELAYRSDISDFELGFVAAGALEDLLSNFGEQLFERLETAVRQEARARFMVAGVWQGGMSNSLWRRFTQMRERFGIHPI